jgi:hypothetical protein
LAGPFEELISGAIVCSMGLDSWDTKNKKSKQQLRNWGSPRDHLKGIIARVCGMGLVWFFDSEYKNKKNEQKVDEWGGHHAITSGTLWIQLFRLGLGGSSLFVGLAYQDKDIVFRLNIEYSSLMDFGP